MRRLTLLLSLVLALLPLAALAETTSEPSWLDLVWDWMTSVDYEGCIPSEIDDCGIQEPQ